MIDTPLRYSQCWEDADQLIEALDIQPGDNCLSIVSGGDNTLAMLSRNPSWVVAIDFNPVQIALLELKVAAFRALSHPQLLELVGSRTSERRAELYAKCRNQLSRSTRDYWDAKSKWIDQGIGHAGRFEQYLRLFRTRVLPLIHNRKRIAHWLQCSSSEELVNYYHDEWDTWRWRLLFRLFFSRSVMQRLGRDPRFFHHAIGDVSARLLQRTKEGLINGLPADNPYLHWILTGHHGEALPYAFRQTQFESIRENLNHLEWYCVSLDDYLARTEANAIKRFNLSNVFEYLSEEHYHRLLERVITVGQPGGRLAYWNMMVPRCRPDYLSARLLPLRETADRLKQQSKVFFYGNFILEELRPPL